MFTSPIKRIPLSPQDLRSLVKQGHTADFSRISSEGSNFIADILLDETDHRPVWLLAWGGINTVAAALEKIKNQHPTKKAYVESKARIHSIGFQEEKTNYRWIFENYPKLLFVVNSQFFAIAYEHQRNHPYKNHEMFSLQYVNTSIKGGRGALGET